MALPVDEIAPVASDGSERPVPSIWRPRFRDIVEAFKDGDYGLKKKITNVAPVDQEDASIIAENIEDYGGALVSLPEEAWETSACLWMSDYWEVYVDLYTEDEDPSDLVLAVRVYKDGTTISSKSTRSMCPESM